MRKNVAELKGAFARQLSLAVRDRGEKPLNNIALGVLLLLRRAFVLADWLTILTAVLFAVPRAGSSR